MALTSNDKHVDNHQLASTYGDAPICAESNVCITAGSEQKSDKGVSVENALLVSSDTEAPKWFFMRASYSRGPKAYEIIKSRGLKAFIPEKVQRSYNNGRYEVKHSYPLPSNVFVYCTANEAYNLTPRSSSPDSIPYLDFTYDHTEENQFGKNPVITIPDSIMSPFIKAASIQHPGAHFVDEKDATIVSGDLVRVIGGPFANIIGKVVKLFGKTRVLVTIPNVISYATAYIDKRNIELVSEEELLMS